MSRTSADSDALTIDPRCGAPNPAMAASLALMRHADAYSALVWRLFLATTLSSRALRGRYRGLSIEVCSVRPLMRP